MDVDLVSESSFEENIQGHSSPPPPPLNSFTQTSPSLSQDSNCQITFLAGHFARYKGQPLPKPNSTVKQVWGSVPNLDRTSTTTVFRHELGTDVSIMEGMFQLIMRGPDHVTGMICNVVNGPQAPINSVPIFTQRLFSILSQSESENLRVCLRRGVMCLFSSHWNSDAGAARCRVSRPSANAFQVSLNVAQLVATLYNISQVLTMHDIHLCIDTLANGDQNGERLEGIHALITGLEESICGKKLQIPPGMHNLRDRLSRQDPLVTLNWGDSPIRQKIIQMIDHWFAMEVREKPTRNPSVHLNGSKLKLLNRGSSERPNCRFSEELRDEL